jgi:hypothetical protein
MDYEVTSHRLSGYKFGDIIREANLGNLKTDLLFLVEAGHLSPLKVKKSAKTIDIDPQE